MTVLKTAPTLWVLTGVGVVLGTRWSMEQIAKVFHIKAHHLAK